MTTIEAINQVLRNTRVKSLSDVNADDALDLVRALNEAVQDFFDLSPAVHKRTTFSHYLAPPETVTGINLATGATTMTSGDPFTSAMRGSTIILDGDPTHNEVVDVDAVLHPYLGSSASPMAGLLYHDAVPITDFAIERLTSNLRLKTLTHPEFELKRVDHCEESWWSQLIGNNGLPEYYRVDYVGGTIQSETDALVIFRLAPRPAVAMSVSFEADVRPLAYALSALQEAKTLPVSRTRANHFLPILEAHLIGSPLWTGNPEATRRVREREMEARSLLRTKMPTDFAKPSHKAGTTYGW